MKTKKLVYGAVIAAIYSILTLILAPISYGAVQVRISEALTILPAIYSTSVFGLFAGCLIANLLTGNIVDIIFGSLTTLIAAICSYYLRSHKWLVPLPPVVLNGLIVGGYLTYLYGGIWYVNMLTVALGQFVSCYIIGMPLLILINNNKRLKEILK